MSLPILLNPLLYLPLIQPLCGMRSHDVGRGVLGVWRDGAEGGVGVFGQVVAFGEAGFDFEDGVREEDGLLLEACEHLLPARYLAVVGRFVLGAGGGLQEGM